MEKLDFLINYLLSERNDVDGIEIPNKDADKFHLYRSLVNIRPAVKADEDFLQAEDEYLTALTNGKGIPVSREVLFSAIQRSFLHKCCRDSYPL